MVYDKIDDTDIRASAGGARGHNKLRCFYLLSQIAKNLSIKTDGGGGSVCIILRSDANEKASFPRV